MVCGASQGIGAATAHELAELGAQVTVLSRSEEKLAEVIKTLPGSQSRHGMIVVDLGNAAKVERFVKDELKSGPIDILVCNAGGPPGGPLLDAKPETFLKGLENHILANNLMAQTVVPGMKEKGYGRIINIISTSVKVPIPNLGVSNTIRGAVASWAKTLATELGPSGITVNNVLPGFTETPRLEALKEAAAERLEKSVDEVEAMWKNSVPMKRFADPREVAAAIAFLATPAAGYINGINIPVDGGRTGCL